LLTVADALDRDLPWSAAPSAWAVLVSEVMLQQTSVARVEGPWRAFTERFASPRACADAQLSEVLTAWRGLGYPRRARDLHRSAQIMCERHDAEVPDTLAELMALPGVGPYTARAVLVFGFSQPAAVVDTNVARVLARCVEARRLTAREAQRVADELVDVRQPTRFNQAMIDLGAQFCRATPRCEHCPMRSSCRWRRRGGEDPAHGSAGVSRAQKPFEGSARQARGRLLARLAEGPLSESASRALLSNDPVVATALLGALLREGLVSRRARRVVLGN